MTRTNQSLPRRLTAALLLVFTIGLTAAGLMFLHETRQTTSGIANQTLTQQARDLAAGIHIVTGAITIEPPAQWAQAYAHPGASYSYTVFKADGSPIAHSASIAAPLPLVTVPAGQSFSSLEL